MMARLVESRRYPGFESCSKLPRSSQALVPEDPELGQDLDLELGPVVEVSLDRPHRVEESCLNFCLTNQHQQMHLLFKHIFLILIVKIKPFRSLGSRS